MNYQELLRARWCQRVLRGPARIWPNEDVVTHAVLNAAAFFCVFVGSSRRCFFVVEQSCAISRAGLPEHFDTHLAQGLGFRVRKQDKEHMSAARSIAIV